MMSSEVSNIRFYFVNGIANTNESGRTTTDLIKDVIKPALNFEPDEEFVTFQHNDAAPTERLLMEVGLVIGGSIAVVHGTYKEANKKGDPVSRLAGVAGACAIVYGMHDYKKMQDDKNRIAESLASRVSQFLDKHKLNIANLIFHSQGADVGYRSLELLFEYKDRIRVITLGAMTTIPNNLCARATNYKFTNDWISRVLALPFEKIRETADGRSERNVTLLKKEGALIHDVSEYLKEKDVQFSLLSLCHS